jgi:uncharacterized metal-binding protein YceD (DUF177 family)
MNNAPLSHVYNLGRLGQSGDEVLFEAGEEQRAGLAALAEVLAVPEFAARIALKKLSPTRFAIHYDLAAAIVQACVVTLEPVSARIARSFNRELLYMPNLRRTAEAKEVIVSPGEEEVPEEIGSLHYDLAVPLVEEFLLAIDPYPRAPGVEFAAPKEMQDAPQSPFAVLKGLKSRG